MLDAKLQPLLESNFTFRFEEAPPQMTNWESLQKVVTYPFQLATSKLLDLLSRIQTSQENADPAAKAIAALSESERASISQRMPAFGKALLMHPRQDPENGFFAEKTRFPELLRQLYPAETATHNDVLLSCDAKFVSQYRKPILHLIGGANIRDNLDAIERCSREILEEYLKGSGEDTIDAADLSRVYSTAMVAKLLFGHPGSIETYREIAEAASLLLNGSRGPGPVPEKEDVNIDDLDPADPYFEIKKLNRKIEASDRYLEALKNYDPTPKNDPEKLSAAIDTLRNAIETSFNSNNTPPLGSLVEKLRNEDKLTELQIKSIIATLYIAGSETSSYLLSSLLWQLGRDPEYQEEIFRELSCDENSLIQKAKASPAINQLFAESIRLFTPVPNVTRDTARDLVCVVEDKQGNELFRTNIPKGTQIHFNPHNAGKSFYQENSEKFDPKRLGSSKNNFSWLPFGDGTHTCPGRWLARADITILVALLVQKYKITSEEKQPERRNRPSTMRMEEEIPIKLEKR